MPRSLRLARPVVRPRARCPTAGLHAGSRLIWRGVRGGDVAVESSEDTLALLDGVSVRFGDGGRVSLETTSVAIDDSAAQAVHMIAYM